MMIKRWMLLVSTTSGFVPANRSLRRTTCLGSSSFDDLVGLVSSVSTCLRLEGNKDYRGVVASDDIALDDAILSIPLSDCLRDDESPSWLDCPDPEGWATRLAACVIDKRLGESDSRISDLWLDLLPDRHVLRSSLPIHWPEELLASCRSLELAVDSAYFARYDAVAQLMASLKEVHEGYSVEAMERVCHDALDVVQTRTCRVECDDRPLRLLAPVFDCFNHDTVPNAAFALEGSQLVVRATRPISRDSEVFISYGEQSTRPSWRCLLSYGFVPEDDDDDTTEVNLDGQRFEVSSTSVSEDLVAWAVSDDSPVTLTPTVAVRLSKRLTEAATDLNDLTKTIDDVESTDALSVRLEAALRSQQQRVINTCAGGLLKWAQQQESIPNST